MTQLHFGVAFTFFLCKIKAESDILRGGKDAHGDPFSSILTLNRGSFPLTEPIHEVSDMKGMFLNTKEEFRILEKDDPVIYSFSEKILPEENAISSWPPLHPVLEGWDEYFMTKGHYHRRPDTSEAYLGLEGEGPS